MSLVRQILRTMGVASTFRKVPGDVPDTFRLSADTLWITTVGTETGPDPSPTTVRYERAR